MYIEQVEVLRKNIINKPSPFPFHTIISHAIQVSLGILVQHVRYVTTPTLHMAS